MNFCLLVILGFFVLSLGDNICNPTCEHGTCIAGNSCLCTTSPGWTGARCEVPICSPGCGPGTCIGPQTCNCTGTKFNGSLCDNPICSIPCSHGLCTAPDTCDCTSTNGSWTGQYCETPLCNPPCDNMGFCNDLLQCNCSLTLGWTGLSCGIPICTDGFCKHNTPCSGPNVCYCIGSGYIGDDCSLNIDECNQVPAPCDPLTKCTDTEGNFTCSACPSGYSGDGKSGCKDINECLVNNGNCDPVAPCINQLAKPNTCGPCPSGYTGSGYTSDGGCHDVNECAVNNGNCDKLTTCNNLPGTYNCSACPDGYSGTGKTACVPICSPSCANGGHCSKPNNCSCVGGWSGAFCTDFACTQTCENGGNCTAPDFCTCPPEWSGSTCAVVYTTGTTGTTARGVTTAAVETGLHSSSGNNKSSNSKVVAVAVAIPVIVVLGIVGAAIVVYFLKFRKAPTESGGSGSPDPYSTWGNDPNELPMKKTKK